MLLERGRHPRFAIGESSTPLANLLIEELADRYALPRLRPFSKWGTWKAAYPGVACGLKRGFTFLRHDPGEPFADNDAHERQLLVAASPHDGIGDTHWYRPDFDHWLAREAEAEGVTYLDETSLDGISFPGDGVALRACGTGDRCTCTRTSSSTPAGRAGSSHGRSRFPNHPPRGCRRRKHCSGRRIPTKKTPKPTTPRTAGGTMIRRALQARPSSATWRNTSCPCRQCSGPLERARSQLQLHDQFDHSADRRNSTEEGLPRSRRRSTRW